MVDYRESIVKYEKYLRRCEKSESTIKSYVWTVNDFFKKYPNLNKANLLLYKESLIKKNKPKTVFLRITALNSFLNFIKKKELTLMNISLPRVNYLENVISNEDYNKLKRCLKRDGYTRDYYLVWLICASGCRISEALQFTVNDIRNGYIGIYGKGMRYRRIYTPSRLQKDMLKWIEDEGLEYHIFLNKNGVTMNIRGAEANFRKYAKKYKLNPKDIHPHSLRHRFALNFIENYKEVNHSSQAGAIADLADILGHASIATTQIYLRRTMAEQREMLERIVNW